MKKILVTGATGFIGNTLVDLLLDRGYQVIPIGRTLKPWSSDYIKQNLLVNDLTLNQLPNLGEIDCVCMLGSVQPFKENKWEKYYQVNSKQIFQFLNQNINQVIYVSTTSVNSINGIPIPLNYYGLSKALGERLLYMNSNKFHQSTVIRFPSVIGVNHHGGIINDLKKWIEFNEEVELYDNGLKLRNILHVNDAVYVILKAIELIDDLRPYEILEVGSRQSEKLVDITKLLMKLMDKKIKINLNDRQTEATDVVVDNATAIEKLNYIPKTIEEGLIQYLRDCNYGL